MLAPAPDGTIAGMDVDMVQGPAWSPPGLDPAGGRYPLRVESHVQRLVRSLLAGVITTTFQARQYSTHGLGWWEADRQGLGTDQARELLRRMEVVLAGVSLRHECPVRLPGPHGGDIIRPELERDGLLDVARLQRPGSYAEPEAGFASTYLGSEVVLGVLRSGRVPAPGPRFELAPVESAIGDLVSLAGHDRIDLATLDAAGHLCVCGAALGGSDGPWLRKVFLEHDYEGPNERTHRARRGTTRLLLAAIARHPDWSPLEAFRSEICFRDMLETDPAVAGIPEGPVWRGVILRNYSVGAWRRLWAWTVNTVSDLGATRPEIAEQLAAALPNCRVSDFLDSVPTSDNGALAANAEEQVRAASWGPEPETELRMLAVGARRLGNLDGPARDAFRGPPDADDLGPRWFARHLDASRRMQLREFGADLAVRLLARSRRVALSKTEWRKDGTLWLPSRLRERAGLYFHASDEGWGDVSLRIDTYASVLSGAGVLSQDEDGWRATDAGVAIVQ
jgi:hypothetical protein